MEQNSYLKRTWANISLDAIVENYRFVRKHAAPDVKVMAVVKADAYGHGVKFVAPALQEAGADWFAVSNLEEALQLRAIGIARPILILGYTPPQTAKLLARHKISQTVFDRGYGEQLSAAAREAGVRVSVHIKVDPGMSRIGFVYRPNRGEATDEMAAVCRLPGLYPEGIFTHFAAADYDGDPDGSFTKRQGDLFLEAVEALTRRGIVFSLRHACNSAGIFTHPALHLDMVRPGIVLYGLKPSAVMELPGSLRPAMELKTVVSMRKTLHAGMTVSYGRTYTASEDREAATVPIGYADGYIRVFGKGYMLVKGRKAPIIGRICMDQLVLDVTGIDGVQPGDEVTVFGRSGNEILTVDEITAGTGLINYETVCIVGKRVPRIFYQGGQMAGQLNYVIGETAEQW